VWLALFSTVRQIERMIQKNLRDGHSLTMAKFDLLAQLHGAPEGLSMSELSERLKVTNGAVTCLVRRAATEKLVTRIARKGDKRRQKIRLSRKGRQVFDNMAPTNQTCIRQAMTGLAAEELLELHSLLSKLRPSATDHGRHHFPGEDHSEAAVA